MPHKKRRNESNKSKAPLKRKDVNGSPGVKKKARAKTKRKTPFLPKRTIAIKYEDIGRPPSTTGRVAKHWIGETLIPAYAGLRKGPVSLPASYRYWDHGFLMDYYGLKGWEFGNWTSQDDRFNYVCGVGISLFDLRQILGFRAKDIGLSQMITMAIGARGRSRAVAHFEPHTYAINLTRYAENSENPFTGQMRVIPKEVRFQVWGGVGSLAHEYGHALDYFFGQYMDHHDQQFALSDGRSVRRSVDEQIIKGNGPRADMEELLKVMYWDDYESGKPTTYYQKIVDYLEERKIKSDYYLRRNEIFARTFEQYIGYKLKQKGMANVFLHKKKYDRIIYANPSLLKKAVPIIDRMIRKMKVWIKQNS